LGEQRDDSLAWAREAIQECLEIARSAGVPLLLEPINRYETDFLNTVDQAVEFLSGIGAHDVGILFDTFHANIEEASLEGTIASYASRIRHVHTADSNRCSPGSGHLDFKSIILALHAAGYQGWLSAEILPRPSAEEAAARTIAHLRPIVQSMITA
jgi:sugar phosphate isomerase/epimerase